MRLGSGGVREIYAYVSALRGDENCGGQLSLDDPAGIVDVVSVYEVGKFVAVILIHHIVGVIVEVIGGGVAAA